MRFTSSFWRLPGSGKLFLARMKRSSCLAAILWFLCLLGASQNASATNYFNWGVETLHVSYGANGNGTVTVVPQGNTTQDCTVSHSGACSMKLVVKGNDNNNNQMGFDLINYGPPYPFTLVSSGKSLYYRWYMRIMPGFSWGSATQKTKANRVAVNSTSLIYTGYLFSSGFVIGECDPVGCRLQNGGSNSADTNLKVPYNINGKSDGLWHEYIVRIKPNTNLSCTAGSNCDAQFEAYVDGVSIGSYNNFKLTNLDGTMEEYWGGWMVRPYFQLNGTTSDGGTIYVDDYSTDDSWNSLIGGSPISSPNPPTNLRNQ